MKIYIITETFPYEGSEIKGVASTEDLANDAVKELKNEPCRKGFWSLIGYEVWDIDGSFIEYKGDTWEEYDKVHKIIQ